MLEENPTTPLGRLVARCGVGGLMMGLANLVPGISGGTMLLAAGIYPAFIGALAEVVTLRFRLRSLVVLATVAGTALTAIVLLAGVVKDLVVDHRWAMYSLFIGLTLGGVPIVKGLLGRLDRTAWTGTSAGLAVMAGLVWFQTSGAGETVARDGFLWMFFAGLASASAMILPGVSGSYLLLVMGAYLPILAGVEAFKNGLQAADSAAILEPLVGVVLPVGIGTVLGLVVVSNALKWLLEHRRRFTLGVLLGLLVGAVAGLYPFQEGVPPEIGDVVKGREVTAESLADLDPEDWPTATFPPTPRHVGGALGLVLVGLAVTAALRRFGSDDPEDPDAVASSA